MHNVFMLCKSNAGKNLSLFACPAIRPGKKDNVFPLPRIPNQLKENGFGLPDIRHRGKESSSAGSHIRDLPKEYLPVVPESPHPPLSVGLGLPGTSPCENGSVFAGEDIPTCAKHRIITAGSSITQPPSSISLIASRHLRRVARVHALPEFRRRNFVDRLQGLDRTHNLRVPFRDKVAGESIQR